jgi:hypothetical protein
MENAGMDESTQAHQSFLMLDWNFAIARAMVPAPEITLVVVVVWPIPAAAFQHPRKRDLSFVVAGQSATR